MASKVNDPRIIVALDFPSADEALSLARRLDPAQCRVKVGKELFTRAGPAVLDQLAARGFQTFLDLKFHDIPNTVARACEAAADLGVWMLNVHALGGRRMMTEAAERLAGRPQRPLLVAVTILTSMGAEDLREVGLLRSPDEHVSQLALLARESGLDGVVCSAREAGMLRRRCGGGFQLVTPGIRPQGSAAGDQTRIATPAEAMRDGASYLVVGRPVTAAPEPLEALAAINQEVADAQDAL